MARERGDVRYPLALTYWGDQGIIKIIGIDGDDLILLPLYSCYQCTIGHLIVVRLNEVPASAEVYAGTFKFTGTVIGPKLGPRFKYKTRPPPESGDTSTMSNSRRSTANQTRFREALCARDAKCLVTGAHFSRRTACHILPQSRPEYYTEVLGYDPGYLFMASFGLLLADDIHHAFDRGENDDIVIHMFCPSDPEWKEYHGKVIYSTRFHTTKAEQPDRRLLLFHYHQCAIMRFRGFWADARD